MNQTTLSSNLPPDIWERILLHDTYQLSDHRHHSQLKALALVNRLFAQICQSRLFSSLPIQTCVTLRYSSERGAPTPKLDWKAWEHELQSVVKAERRLALVAEHAFLAAQARQFVVKGYECRHSYPPHPFQRPPERSALPRSVFDAFTHLRKALHLHLPAFSNLRKLQISNYPVTIELLDAFDAHPSLTELSFNFCWFPETTSPFTSITSLSFHEIPGSHVGRRLLSSNYDPPPTTILTKTFPITTSGARSTSSLPPTSNLSTSPSDATAATSSPYSNNSAPPLQARSSAGSNASYGASTRKPPHSQMGRSSSSSWNAHPRFGNSACTGTRPSYPRALSQQRIPHSSNRSSALSAGPASSRPAAPSPLSPSNSTPVPPSSPVRLTPSPPSSTLSPYPPRPRVSPPSTSRLTRPSRRSPYYTASSQRTFLGYATSGSRWPRRT
ncbi:hypothetical protein FA13DRAFT_1397274 [Coprinellus micaceus]|uniref:F-box domain-containing protein n=1 Tax=Coprinellus micaceus TaxID=71717 RepID=A0A4Y7SRT2_COPMI|nr:hypothetical protein FA13DRAFT_1397274 [Coprinellus micaceus]